MKSKKPVVPLDQIVRKYAITPTEWLHGGVNSVMFHYPPGKEVFLEYPEWEVLFFAGKIPEKGVI